MRFASAFFSLLVATGALAVPVVNDLTTSAAPLAAHELFSRQSSPLVKGCLSSQQALNIINAFIYLLANPTASNYASVADSLLAPSFIEFSDSINQLTGAPQGSATFPSRAAFMAGASSQPPLLLQTQDYFNSCTQIAWVWTTYTGVDGGSEKVEGIDVFVINPQGQILVCSNSFNSGAWLADVGYPECKK